MSSSGENKPSAAEVIATMQDQIEELTERIKNMKQLGSSSKHKPKRPDTYDGKTSVQSFLTAARVYLFQQREVLHSDEDQVLEIASLLTGDAKEWFEPVLRDYTNNAEDDRGEDTNRLFERYVNFEETLRSMYGNSDEARSAAQKLLTFKQKGSASHYTSQFKQLAAKTGWTDDETLIDTFYRGLKDTVKDELVVRDRLQTFDKYTNLAITINNRQHERRQEKKGTYVPKVPNAAKPTINITDTSHGTAPGPMNLGGISQQRNRRQIKCYNCGMMGHIAHNCRSKKQWTPVPEGAPNDGNNHSQHSLKMIRLSNQNIKKGMQKAKRLARNASRKKK